MKEKNTNVNGPRKKVGKRNFVPRITRARVTEAPLLLGGTVKLSNTPDLLLGLKPGLRFA